MKSRTIAVLLGAILLLGLIAVLADRTEKAQYSAHASGRLFPGFEAAKALKIEIKSQDKTTTLEKKDGAWKVAPGDLAADETAVSEALTKLEKIEKAEVAAENPEKHAALEVKEGDTAGVELRIWSNTAGDPALHCYIGKTGGDFQSNFVRLASEKVVYRSREILRPSFDRPKGWRDRSILKFAPEDVVRLDLSSDQGHWVIERTTGAPEPDAWSWVTPEPGPALTAGVDGILRALSDFQADEFSASEDPVASGIAEPKSRALVVLKDGRTLDLLWGNDAEQGRVYVKRADITTIWEVMTYKKNQVFPRIETLKAMPSPTPTPEASPAPGP